MHRHRSAADYGDQLHLEPQYVLRYLFGCLVVAFWVVMVILAITREEFWTIPNTDRSLGRILVYLLTPLVLGGAAGYLRGQYLCFDRRQRQILTAQGFLGLMLGDWKAVAPFDPEGVIRIQFCQAELQSLAVMSYQAPGGQDWLMIHIYTDRDLARQVAQEIEAWEVRLEVIVEEDQSALPEVRSQKPLVE